MRKTVFYILMAFYGCGEIEYSQCLIESENLEYQIIPHSHNDYEQEFPLITALEHKFLSIEVDIYMENSNLFVSHDNKNLTTKSLLTNQYLDPLVKQLNEINFEIILLVDLKNYSTETINILNKTLANYSEHLVSRSDSENHRNKIKIILSGDIDRNKIITNQDSEYLFIDGRLSDLNENYPSHIVPIISENFSSIINNSHLDKIVNDVHSNKKLIRFWNTSDNEETWLKLINKNVDIIGVDNINHFYCTMKNNGLVN